MKHLLGELEFWALFVVSDVADLPPERWRNGHGVDLGPQDSRFMVTSHIRSLSCSLFWLPNKSFNSPLS
jgi:hypothetical protein